MKLKKIKTYELEKCYSIAPLLYQGKQHILVAAEKINKCLLFDLYGNLEETVWDTPGGTMSMVQVPGSDGWFLATHKFYSPNDSKEAEIVLVTPKGRDDWQVQTIVKLPFVHRFDILTRNGAHYLIACTLKSGHEYKDDWSSPGAVWGCRLPDEPEGYKENSMLSLTCLKEGMLKNHGYCRCGGQDDGYGLISAENGIFRVTPPDMPDGEWRMEQLTKEPASDVAAVDFDGDGSLELIAIAPFHGNEIKIYHLEDGKYQVAYRYEQPAEFGHAIWAGNVYGKPGAVIGYRKEKREILGFTYENGYHAAVLETDAGSANVMRYERDGVECMVSANREINEIAFYEIEKE
ncbi:MAG: hypothetical protein KH366_01260 [Clostridiaceae bacterium]|nr:hypothetical protein [Clostridiaceae bacterium]